MRTTYYTQYRRLKKGQLQLALQPAAPSSESRRKAFHRHTGIPEFEFRTPGTPFIVQSEMFKFTGLQEGETIGFDFAKIKENFPFMIKRDLQMDRAAEKAAGFNNFRSFPNGQLDYANPEGQWIKDAHRRNQAHRARIGRGHNRPPGPDWQDDCPPDTPYFPEANGKRRRPDDPRRELDERDKRLMFLDRLALGDPRAGHILYLLEQEFGSIRFE